MQHSRNEIRAYPKLLDWLRYFSAFLLYMYGLSKLLHLQFHLPTDISHRSIGSLTGYQLTWYYYGYSRVYASILGLTQVTGATLLLFRKSALLGTVLMAPVMANILLINLFILVNDYGPEFIAALILTSMLILLWHQRHGLFKLFWANQTTEPAESGPMHRWIRVLIVLIVTVILVGGQIMMHYIHR